MSGSPVRGWRTPSTRPPSARRSPTTGNPERAAGAEPARPIVAGWNRLPPEAPALTSAGAAVLAVLRTDGPETETLLIQRSERPSDPGSGQVALPGGRRAGPDRTLVDTALREAREEVGLRPEALAGIPRFLDVFPASAFGLDVAVFVALLARGSDPGLTADPIEVESIFWLPRSRLERTEPVPRQTRIGLLEVEATRHEGHVLWGFTLRVLQELFERLERPAEGS